LHSLVFPDRPCIPWLTNVQAFPEKWLATPDYLSDDTLAAGDGAGATAADCRTPFTPPVDGAAVEVGMEETVLVVAAVCAQATGVTDDFLLDDGLTNRNPPFVLTATNSISCKLHSINVSPRHLPTIIY